MPVSVSVSTTCVHAHTHSHTHTQLRSYASLLASAYDPTSACTLASGREEIVTNAKATLGWAAQKTPLDADTTRTLCAAAHDYLDSINGRTGAKTSSHQGATASILCLDGLSQGSDDASTPDRSQGHLPGAVEERRLNWSKRQDLSSFRLDVSQSLQSFRLATAMRFSSSFAGTRGPVARRMSISAYACADVGKLQALEALIESMPKQPMGQSILPLSIISALHADV